MGYGMQQRDGHFRIAVEKLPAALLAVQAITEQKPREWGGSHFSSGMTVPEMLEAWSWKALCDPATGDLIDLVFFGKQLGAEAFLFQALAPFVDAGSYLEMLGEDGEFWRWAFDGQHMREQFPQGVRQRRILWE